MQQNESDKSIMTEVTNWFESTTDINAIYRVRQLHDMHTISKVCTTNGRQIVFFWKEKITVVK